MFKTLRLPFFEWLNFKGLFAEPRDLREPQVAKSHAEEEEGGNGNSLIVKQNCELTYSAVVFISCCHRIAE